MANATAPLLSFGELAPLVSDQNTHTCLLSPDSSRLPQVKNAVRKGLKIYSLLCSFGKDCPTNKYRDIGRCFIVGNDDVPH